MKCSQYNYLVKDEGKCILYNSVTGKIIVYDLSYYERLQSILDHISDTEDHLTTELMQHRFIIDADTDEFSDICEITEQCLRDKTLFLMILPTEQCNFRCAYCYEEFAKGSMPVHVQDAIVRFVENNLENYRALHIEWYGGEPLVAMNVIERLSERLIEVCKIHRKPYYSMMTTNGSLLNAANLVKLKKARVTRFQISIDGFAETHNKQRYGVNKSPTWNGIIENLRYFRDNIKSSTMKVMFRVNLTRDIFTAFDDFLNFYNSEFGNDKRFTFFLHMAQDWGNMQSPDIKKNFSPDEDFYSSLTLMKQKKVTSILFYDFLQPTVRICYAAKENFMLIRSDGSIGRCSLKLNDFYKGNIKDLNKIETPLDFMQVKANLPEACFECKKLPLCFGLVCPTNSGHIKDTCGIEMKNIEELIKYVAATDARCIDHSYIEGALKS